MANSQYRVYSPIGLVDEYGQITLMNKGFDSPSSRPPMLLLYNKHGATPWHNVEQNLVLHNNGQMQPRTNRGLARIRLLSQSLPLIRRALIHQMTMKKTMYHQILILTQHSMMRDLNTCLRKRIPPTGGIRERKCSVCWNSRTYSFLLHPILQVRTAPAPYQTAT